jgi:hypothetical protein
MITNSVIIIMQQKKFTRNKLLLELLLIVHKFSKAKNSVNDLKSNLYMYVTFPHVYKLLFYWLLVTNIFTLL